MECEINNLRGQLKSKIEEIAELNKNKDNLIAQITNNQFASITEIEHLKRKIETIKTESRNLSTNNILLNEQIDHIKNVQPIQRDLGQHNNSRLSYGLPQQHQHQKQRHSIQTFDWYFRKIAKFISI